MDVLISAGATRNPIDAMRYLSARSTGATGLELARRLRDLGLRPHVLGSAECLLRGPDVSGEEYGSTRDLMARVERWVRANPYGAFIHAAAVGDYERADADSGKKTPSGMASWELVLTPTPKIADHVRGWGLVGPYVTFKAASPETTPEDLAVIADRQRLRTGSDLVFANVLGRTATGVLIVSDTVKSFDHRPDAIDALVTFIAERAR